MTTQHITPELQTLILCHQSIALTGANKDIRAIAKATAEMLAADAPPDEDFCYCNKDVSLQIVSGGGAPEGYLGKVTLRIGDQYRDYYTHPAESAQQVASPPGYKLVPLEPTQEIISAMACSQARDDEGLQLTLMDLIGFSGENKTHTLLKAAYRDAIAASPKYKP